MDKTKAISMYENKKVNLNTAAWIGDLSVGDFMSELESRGIALNLTPEMFTYSLDVLANI